MSTVSVAENVVCSQDKSLEVREMKGTTLGIDNAYGERMAFKFRTNFPKMIRVNPSVFSVDSGQRTELAVFLSRKVKKLSASKLNKMKPKLILHALPMMHFTDEASFWDALPLDANFVPTLSLKLVAVRADDKSNALVIVNVADEVVDSISYPSGFSHQDSLEEIKAALKGEGDLAPSAEVTGSAPTSKVAGSDRMDSDKSYIKEAMDSVSDSELNSTSESEVPETEDEHGQNATATFSEKYPTTSAVLKAITTGSATLGLIYLVENYLVPHLPDLLF